MRKSFIAAAAALAAVSSAAMASVSFDSTTGTGFVGKGDIQTLYGWNDATLQKNAAGVTFAYNVEETYRYDCTFTIVIGKDKTPTPQTVTRGKSTSVNGAVAYDSRKNGLGKITGFNLTGFGATVSDGVVPVEGGSCPGGPLNDGTISNVVLQSSTGGLSVSYGGVSYPLPNTPVL